MNVVLCSSVLSSTNNLHDVGAMVGCMYYSGGREPQCPVTTASLAYSGTFLWQSVWSYDPYASSFETLSCVGNIDGASQQVIIDENQLGYSCIL